MFPWNVAIISAIVMFILEYLVLVRVYEKNYNNEWSVFIIPPILLIIAQGITYWIQDRNNSERKTFNPFLLVLIFVLLKLPFSYARHDIVPNIGLLERLAISAAEAISATIIAEGIVALMH